VRSAEDLPEPGPSQQTGHLDRLSRIARSVVKGGEYVRVVINQNIKTLATNSINPKSCFLNADKNGFTQIKANPETTSSFLMMVLNPQLSEVICVQFSL
jgi:hypothetical protein